MTGLLLFSVLLLAWSSASSPEQWTSCRESSSPHRFTLFQENVCNLHFIADPTLWRHFKYERFGTVLTDEQTSERIETFFAGHVSALKRIFGDAEFTTYDGRETWRGLDFQMDRSTIMTDTTAKCNTRDESLLCWPDLIRTDELLHSISTRNHDEHCLVIYFTYRQTYGVLSGLYKPFPDKPEGGVCGRYVEHNTETGTQNKSTNVMWVTLVDKHDTLTERESHIMVAHTVSLALGSAFGDGPDCVPGRDSSASDFILKALPDLNELTGFSTCSKDGIAHFLSSVFYGRHGRHNCLKPSISGGGLLHGFVDPEMCSEKDNPDLSDHDFTTKDEL